MTPPLALCAHCGREIPLAETAAISEADPSAQAEDGKTGSTMTRTVITHGLGGEEECGGAP